MSSKEFSTLIQYLADGRDFLQIVNAAFSDCLAGMPLSAIYLYQISPDRTKVHAIAECCTDDALKVELNRDVTRETMPYLGEKVDICYVSDNERLLISPIFIRNEVAMYIVARRNAGFFADVEIQNLAQMTMILQSVALERNFKDSIENSYRFLESVIDEIPIGLSVLTPDSGSYLLMNQVAVESQSVQNVMRMAIAEYAQTRSYDMDELYDEETGFWYDVRFHDAFWIDGSKVLICTTIDVTQKMKNQQMIEYQANNDYLTGLFNRMKCERDLRAVIDKATSENTRGVVLFLDLDNFKQVNDGLGHQYGDVLLQEIAAGIQSIPQIENHCYRMGGDEFVIVILPEYFNEITGIVEAISKMFNEPWHLMGVEYYCTMSMGLAIFPDHGTATQDVIKKADFAMYEAKKSGKNRYLWYTPNSEADADKESMEEALRSMVGEECKDFTLHYQPVFDGDGRLLGAEALVRINSSRFGEKLPAEFLPMAEYLGIMNRIGNHVLEIACEKLMHWKTVFSPDFKMFVNISATQLLQTKAVDLILKAIRRSGTDPGNVVLDVSEGMELRDEDKAYSTLEILHAHGVGIAIDDFGLGSQSLTMVERAKASYVKLDKSNLNLEGDLKSKEGIIAALNALGKEWGSTLGFVGVETGEQHEFALAHHAGLLMGYYYGEPLDEEAFEARWKDAPAPF